MGDSRRQDFLSYIVLALVSLLMYLPMLFEGRVPVFRDLSNMLLPFEYLVTQAPSAEFPLLWNPYGGTGEPLAALAIHAPFSPLEWLARQFSFPHSVVVSLFLNHFVAGLGFYCLVLLVTERRWIAVLCALAFSFGGLMISADGLFNLLRGYAWLPWISFCAYRLLQKPQLSFFLGLVVVTAAAFLSGLPEAVVFGLFIQVLLLMVMLPEWTLVSLGTRVSLLGTALVAGVLLSAVQLLPLAELLADSGRAKGLSADAVLRYSLGPAELPRLFLYSAERSVWDFFQSLFLGVFALLGLGGAFIVLGQRQGWRWGFGFLLGCYLSFGEASPGLRWLVEHVPGLASIRYPAKWFIVPWSLLILSAAVLLARVEKLWLERPLPLVSLRGVSITGLLLVLYNAEGFFVTEPWHRLQSTEAASQLSEQLPLRRVYSSLVGIPETIPSFPDRFELGKELLTSYTGALSGIGNLTAGASISRARDEELLLLVERSPKEFVARILAELAVQAVLAPIQLRGYPGLELGPERSLSPLPWIRFLYRVDRPKPFLELFAQVPGEGTTSSGVTLGEAILNDTLDLEDKGFTSKYPKVPCSSTATDRVLVKKFSPDVITIEARIPGPSPCWLLVRQRHDFNWKRVLGPNTQDEVTPLKAEGHFQAYLLQPEGGQAQQIELRYSPLSYRIGRTISIVALLVVVLAVIAILMGGRARQQTPILSGAGL